ncbi:MAG: hypothetical protein ACTXOO_02640 [Sodalis sp. (in: enterobacteria)]
MKYGIIDESRVMMAKMTPVDYEESGHLMALSQAEQQTISQRNLSNTTAPHFTLIQFEKRQQRQAELKLNKIAINDGIY